METTTVEKKIKIGETDPLLLFGANDAYLQFIESRFDSAITFRNNTIMLRGVPAEVKKLETVFDEMMYCLKKKGVLTMNDVAGIIEILQGNSRSTQRESAPQQFASHGNQLDDTIILWGRKEPIKARTKRQQEYWNSVRANDVVFSIGPAGTGKTYLAVAMALAYLRSNEIQKIVLTRPAVEAGESLGFLPGDLFEKVNPYLRPLLDAVSDMVTPDKLKSLNEKNIIEIVPLAYMRGRTLNNAFIILDEAQNTTTTQMKMFLTRLGHGSKAIITGDITQIDLNSNKQSGLVDVQHILRNVPGIGFTYFEKSDVVRHRLVAEIINAYEQDAERKERIHTDGNPPA
ncbi:MAG: PhoH family protein [Candidatus Kapabacteria bacterium]|nr:PhoH family protein [Candidatus Kapabacteria bacterium]